MKIPRQRRSVFALGILTAIVGSLPALGSPFYDYRIIARTGVDLDGSGFVASSISPLVSLNESGAVAFIASAANGRNGVFVAEPAGGGFTIRKLAETANGSYGSAWLNNNNQEAVCFRATPSRGVTSSNVRRYTPTGPGAPYLAEPILKGTTARQTVTVDPCLPWAGCPFTQRFRVEAFDDILDPVSLNDSGTVASLATAIFDNGQTFYYLTAQSQYPETKDPSAVLPQQVSGFLPDFKPVIANSGEIVTRVGNHDDSPILLYPPGLGTPQAIAGSASFTKIGQCPGLSDDGQVVAFYGELKSDKTKQTTLRHCNVASLPTIPTPPVRTA